MAHEPILDALPSHLVLSRVRDGLALHLAADVYIGRSLATYGEYCQLEADVLRQLVPAGGSVVEAGANIGAHTVPLARAAGPTGVVYAFEPQRVLFQILCANLALNGIGTVRAHQAGLGARPGILHIPDTDYALPGNFGGVGLGEVGDPVPVDTIDGMDLKRLDLIKIDVEGMEDQVLAGAAASIARLRPVLYLENDRDDRQQALIRQVMHLGYRLWWHVSPLFNPDNRNGRAENLFQGLVSINMLAVPVERPMAITGMKEITDETVDWRD